MEENVVFNSEDVNSNKVFGVLAYIGILFLVPLLGAKDSQYARFHANQGLVLFIFEIAATLAGGILSFIITLASLGILGFLGVFIILAIAGCSIALMIIGIINACSGEAKKLPIIGGITLLH